MLGSAEQNAASGGARATGSAPRRAVAHLDIDAFYASVELRRRPELRGKPLIVGGLGPRSVVTTASYEARKFGVGSAMPMARARSLCPHAVVLPPDMAAYKAASEEVWHRIRLRFERVQQAGIDEAYVDLTGVAAPLRQLRAAIAEIQAATGLVISIGVGPNRLVAKTASGACKPQGFAVYSREQACEAFGDAPARTLQGVGPRTAERLAELGIETIAQLRAADVLMLAEKFGGDWGVRMRALAEFRDESQVVTHREPKSASRETTFAQDITEHGPLLAQLDELAERLAEDLARKDLAGRTVGIKVRLADWTTITRAHTLEAPTRSAEVLRREARRMFEREAIDAPVRLLGVRSAGFESTEKAKPKEPAGRRRAPGQLELPLS